MQTIEQLAKEFGTHDHYINLWITSLNITEEEISFSLASLDKMQRRTLMSEYLRPLPYLIEYPQLLNSVGYIDTDTIKSLPESIYNLHLEQLKIADSINDKINNRTYPYQSYDAEVFCTLRNSRKTTEISFIKKMFTRSISHHSYPKAKQKLRELTLSFAA